MKPPGPCLGIPKENVVGFSLAGAMALETPCILSLRCFARTASIEHSKRVFQHVDAGTCATGKDPGRAGASTRPAIRPKWSHKFLNFKHSETSGSQLRIVNTNLQALQAGIESGNDLSIHALRILQSEDQTNLFLKPEDDASPTAENGQVRRRRRYDPEAIKDAARQQGINPDFDLDISGSDARLRELQSLLFPDELERRLQSIYDKERRSVQELGISTLYLCIGFLEWYEADYSDKQYLAPLVLYPIELKRGLHGSKYRFTVHGIGEDPENNISLRERLTRDFAIRLPEFNPQDMSIARYLALIGEAASEKKRWQVRTMATITMLNFAKLAMYRDLDPEQRPPNGKLESNSVIVDVLSGSDVSSSFSPDGDDLELGIPSKVPLLVTEADSSQWAAIAAALSPKNLVIEGPPGTGKSQTITNIIAGAMAKGMTVLFVAEKLAALQVVKSKIDFYGLGNYCLELHSTKARKVDVYQSIGQRLDEKRPPSPNVDAVLSDIDQQRRVLDEYLSALHSVHDASGDSVHDLLWREQRLRLELDALAESIEHFDIAKGDEYSPSKIAAACQNLDAYEATLSGISESYGDPSHHPWFGFQGASTTLSQRRQLIERFRIAHAKLEAFHRACCHFADVGKVKFDLTIGQWIEIASFACNLAQMDPSVPSHVLKKLRGVDAIAIVRRFLDNIIEARSIEERVGSNLLSALKASESHYRALEAIREASLPGSSLNSAPLSELPQLIDKVLSRISTLEAIKKFGSLLDSYVTEITRESISAVQNIKAILDQTSRQILLARTPTLAPEQNETEIEAICNEGQALLQRRKAAEAKFDVLGLGSADSLREYARALREAGIFWWLNANIRKARRLYRRCVYAKSAKSNDAIAAEFSSIADMLSTCQDFEEAAAARSLLGDRFRGLHTDFEALRSLIAYLRSIRPSTRDQLGVARAFRDVLLYGDVAEIDSYLALFEKSPFPQLVDYINNHSWPRLGYHITELELLRDLLRQLRSQVSSDGVDLSSTVSEVFSFARDARNHRDIVLKVNGDGAAKELIQEYFQGMDSDVHTLRSAISYMTALNDAWRKLPAAVLDKLAALDRDGIRDALALLMPFWLSGPTAVSDLIDEIQGQDILDSKLFFGRRELRELELSALIARLARAVDHAITLDDWIRYLNLRRLALEVAGPELLSYFERHNKKGGAPLSRLFSYLVVRSTVRAIIENQSALKHFPGVTLQAARERFRELDTRVIEMLRGVLAAKLHVRPVDWGNSLGSRGTWTGRALLMNEVTKQKRHIPIRDAVQRAGLTLQQIKPCFMMSPLSVAQYLPPGSVEFDLVVIDEASQMKPEDALVALSRGKHAVVVGDPKQLPPTSFFEREIEEEEVSDEDAVDNESVLTLAMQQYRKRRLRWHYRSRHESLIAFSNHHFYDNDLIVFPSPAPASPWHGVRNHFIGGEYKSSANPDEVAAVTAAAIRFMKDSPKLSLGIVAINREQRELINDEMTRLIASDPDATKYVDRWDATLYPFFVKNLESVQGDERDVIFISTVYGPETKGGTVAQRFGPILGPSGWRRLNVLFTRARERVEVFTSMNPADVRVDERSGQGVRALRDYLEYAANGRLETGLITRRRPDSDFEIAVGSLLESAGYEVEPQVGVAHYFIDLAVRHPRTGNFVIGIECDGATYHSAKSARDRDRTREEALRALGWDLYRIWSTDWFADPRREFGKLQQFLKSLIG